MAVAFGSVIFLATPFTSAFAHEKHCEIKDTQLSDTMKYMKSELRGYVKGFKGDDAEKMQQHLNELLKLSSMLADQTPVKIKNMHAASMDHEQMDMSEMDHAKMDMQATPEMDHSKMDHSKMDHGDMEMNHGDMEMNHGDMAMPEMDHSKMDHGDMDMAEQPEMDHSKMDHGDMNMDSEDHDMSAMPTMEGMTAEQHHQHMLYMHGITQLQDLFKELDKTQDKAEIKTILGQIKEHSKKSHQQFRQNCD